MKTVGIPAVFLPALGEIAKKRDKNENIVVAIDGLCGVGKSTFARIAADFLGANVVHMDDFYLSKAQRPANWREIPAGHMDLERLRAEVLVPVREGKSYEYRPFDCHRQKIGQTILMLPKPLTILEGSYSHHPALGPWMDCKIFLTCAEEVRMRRLKEREGERFAAFREIWMPLEERYIAELEIGKTNSLTVGTTEL